MNWATNSKYLPENESLVNEMINKQFTCIRIEHWISLFTSTVTSDDNDSELLAL
jgi:hypothetical protein